MDWPTSGCLCLRAIRSLLPLLAPIRLLIARRLADHTSQDKKERDISPRTSTSHEAWMSKSHAESYAIEPQEPPLDSAAVR